MFSSWPRLNSALGVCSRIRILTLALPGQHLIGHSESWLPDVHALGQSREEAFSEVPNLSPVQPLCNIGHSAAAIQGCSEHLQLIATALSVLLLIKRCRCQSKCTQQFLFFLLMKPSQRSQCESKVIQAGNQESKCTQQASQESPHCRSEPTDCAKTDPGPPEMAPEWPKSSQVALTQSKPHRGPAAEPAPPKRCALRSLIGLRSSAPPAFPQSSTGSLLLKRSTSSSALALACA